MKKKANRTAEDLVVIPDPHQHPEVKAAAQRVADLAAKEQELRDRMAELWERVTEARDLRTKADRAAESVAGGEGDLDELLDSALASASTPYDEDLARTEAKLELVKVSRKKAKEVHQAVLSKVGAELIKELGAPYRAAVREICRALCILATAQLREQSIREGCIVEDLPASHLRPFSARVVRLAAKDPNGRLSSLLVGAAEAGHITREDIEDVFPQDGHPAILERVARAAEKARAS